MKTFYTFLLLALFSFTVKSTFAHSVQVAYCISCTGQLTLYVEHWHGNASPTGTTMTISLTVNGVTTTQTGSPIANLQNVPFAQLPNCASPPVVFASCPGNANTYNDWVVYTYNVPANSNVQFQVLAGNNFFTEDACGMFPATSQPFVVTPLNQPPITIPPSTVCSQSQSNGITFPPGNPSGGTYIWSNDNTSIGIPATGSGNIPAFTPPATNTTQVANITVSYLCATTNFTITVLPSAGPNFNYVNIVNNSLNGANSSVQCYGDSTLFQAQASGGVTIQSVLWDFGDGSTSTVMNPKHLFQNTGTYTVNLQVTTTDGCTQTSTSTIVVHPKPSASFTTTANCEYDAAIFTNTSSVASGAITGWNWNFGDGNTATTQNPTHLYAQDGSYPVNLVITSDVGCTDTVSGNQLIYEKPIASFTKTDECLNVSTIFTDASTASVALTNWNWDYENDGTIDNTNQNNTYVYPSFGNKNIRLEVQDANGCIDDTVIIATVHPLPIANFNSDEVCPTFATTFTNTSTVANPGVINAWNWDFDNTGNFDQTTQNANFTWNTGGSYYVKLMVETADGCKDSILNTIIVNPKPVASFTVQSVCKNDVTPFTNTSTVALGSNTLWEWDFGDGNTGTTQSPSHTYINDGTFNTTMIVTSDKGCKDTVTNPTIVYSLPIASFTSSIECLNVATVLTDASSTAYALSFWEWDVDNDGAAESSNQNTSEIYTTFGFHPVHLTVTDIYGCQDDTTADIEVKPLPQAIFASTNECPNFATSLTNASTVDSPGIINAWNWDINNTGSVDQTSQNASFTWDTGGSYDVELMVETADGCKDSIVNTITVYPKPIASFSNTTICFGTVTNFTDNSTVNLNNSIIAWDWDFDDTNTSLSQNPSNLYASYGLYNVSLKIETNNGCKDTVVNEVEVYGMPVVNFSMPNVCEYTDVQFTNNTTIPSADNMTYLWNFGDNSILSVETPSHNYSSEGIYNVNLQATSSNGCIHDTTINVTIYDEPLAQFAMTNGCEYETFSFTDYSTTNATLSTWEWDFSDGNTSNQQSPINNFSSEGNYPIQLIVVTSDNCSDTSIVNLEVYPKPHADFTPTDVCLNVPTVFEDISTISTSVFSSESVLPYSGWLFGDGATASGSTVSHTYSSPGSYNAQIVIVSNHNCKDTSYLEVIVHSNPIANFTSENVAGCNPVETVFTNTSTIDNNPQNYTYTSVWYLDNDSIATTENTTSIFTNNDNIEVETYGASLVVTTNVGCKDSIRIDDIVSVYPIPVADFNYSPDEIEVYDAQVDFNDVSIVASEWSWEFGDGATSIEQNPSYIYADSGLYTINLRIENSYGCADSISKSLHIKPVYELFIPNSITPNGDGKNDVFKVRGYGINDIEMLIYDKWGKLIFEGYKVDSEWDGYVNGKLKKTAVYVYIIKAIDLNNEAHLYKGSVTVIH